MIRRCLPLALLLALLAGCAETGKPPAAPVVLPTIASHYERRLADGTFVVAANLKNPAATPVTVRVGCQFLNAQGQPLPEMTHRQTVTVAAGGTETVQFGAASGSSRGVSADAVAAASGGATAPVAGDDRDAVSEILSVRPD